VNSLSKTVTRQRRDCDLNPGPTAPESSTLNTRLPTTEQPVTNQEHIVRILENLTMVLIDGVREMSTCIDL